MNGFKETEIGLIPEDWDIFQIYKFLFKTKTDDPRKKVVKLFQFKDICIYN